MNRRLHTMYVKTCVENIQWTNGIRKRLTFGIPMVYHERKNYVNDCYRHLTDVSSYSKRMRQKISYTNLDWVFRSVPHSDDIYQVDVNYEHDNDTDFVETSTKERENTQEKLNNLVRDLEISKELSEMLVSRLKRNSLRKKQAHFAVQRVKWHQNLYWYFYILILHL